ncbi:hypothetical protein [Pedobacter sp.]|uniref:hypothetical protein n=1 Tax=Pedobacter sp. TaxID=1411316 RepID=UPI003D7FB69F
MLRRSLFNLLLGNSEATSLTQETVTGIAMPDYLKTEDINPLVQEFDEITPGQEVELMVSTAHFFNISWSLATGSSVIAGLKLGIKVATNEVQLPIELGLHADGYLFIGGVKDNRRISKEKSTQSLQLLLEVHPQAGNLTYARLTLKDHYGLTLATVKNRSFSTENWAGKINNVGQFVKHLKIEGSTLNKFSPNKSEYTNYE